MPAQINTDLLRKITGQKIKTMRQRLNITQDQLSQRIGMTRAIVNHVESGKQNITTYSCMALCLFFKCTPNDLYPTMDEYNRGLKQLGGK